MPPLALLLDNRPSNHTPEVAARGPGLLVDRARIDALLLGVAAERGRIVTPVIA